MKIIGHFTFFLNAETATGYNEFRRLPQIPDSFINLFSGRTPKTEIEEKLKIFFPEKKTTVSDSEINVPTSTSIPNTSKTIPIIIPNIEASIPTSSIKIPNIQSDVLNNTGPLQILDSAKAAIQEEQLYMKQISISKQQQPQNFPNDQELEEIYKKEDVDRSSIHSYVDENRRRYVPPAKIADANVEKGKFEVSVGTELVMRGYGQCSVDRGSPIRNKKRVVISWSETPVRIFGGAMVANAKNSCGQF